MDTYKIQAPLKSFSECFIWLSAFNCKSVSYKVSISPQIRQVGNTIVFSYRISHSMGDTWEGVKFSCPVKNVKLFKFLYNANPVYEEIASTDKIKTHINFDAQGGFLVQGEIDTSVQRADITVLQSYFSTMNYFTIHKSE